MAESFVVLPIDTSNQGKLVRTNTRTVNGSTVHEHFNIIQDYNNNFQAQVISGPTLAVTGLAVYSVQAGSYLTYGTLGASGTLFPISGIVNIGLGSVRVTNASFGSEVFMPVGSVTILSSTGSLEVYQTINSDMQVQATQETSPWVVSGTATVAGSVFTTGSVNIAGWPGSLAISNFAAIGSRVFITNLGDLGSVVTGSIVPEGYSNFDIIRKGAGSPATDFVFAAISRSVFVENLGSNIVYFAFNATANPANSGTGLLNSSDSINLDLRVGSVSVQSSGATTTEVQVVGIR